MGSENPDDIPEAAVAPPSSQPLPYFRPLEGRLVTLAKMDLMEAEIACSKLQSEGLFCYVADQAMATVTISTVLGKASLLVHEADLERAREILAQPAPDDAEGEYADEDWRCPKCHRRSVELESMSRGWKLVTTCVVAMFVSIPAYFLLSVIFPLGEWLAPLGDSFNTLAWGWVMLTAALAIALALRPRRVRCTSCHHEWRKGQASA